MGGVQGEIVDGGEKQDEGELQQSTGQALGRK